MPTYVALLAVLIQALHSQTIFCAEYYRLLWMLIPQEITLCTEEGMATLDYLNTS